MSVDSWTLQVKSLDQTTQSVTVSSSASVLQLKEAIQPVFDIASHRQRLIFQGKVLKDGKLLTEYANLQDGKIIHLVSRPADAPANPLNDDPQTTNTQRGTTPPQLFPSMFGPSEGYTFITVDANIGELGENNSTLTSLLSSLFGASGAGGLDSLRRNGASPQNRRESEDITSRSLFSMEMGRNRRPSSDPSSSLFDGARQYFNSITSFETRLTRVLAAIENIQANLEAPSTNTDTDLTWSAMTNANSEQTQSIRSRLRANGANETVQIGMTVSHLTDLMVTMVPRLRQLAQDLQAETRSTMEPTPELRRMVAIIRNVSMVHHAIGNIMAGSEDPSRRRESSPLGRTRTARTRRQQQQPPPPPPPPPTTTTTSATTTPTDTPTDTPTSILTSSSRNKRQTRSSTAAAAAASSSSSSKRQKTSPSDTDTKSTRKGKGKRRDDTN